MMLPPLVPRPREKRVNPVAFLTRPHVRKLIRPDAKNGCLAPLVPAHDVSNQASDRTHNGRKPCFQCPAFSPAIVGRSTPPLAVCAVPSLQWSA